MNDIFDLLDMIEREPARLAAQEKRDLKWDARFIELARHVSQWSKDPSSKCGAVIVDEKRRVVSVGFNGFAKNTDDSPEAYANREYKYENVIHCEENAIIQATESLEGFTMYLTGAGCSRCTARVIQAGIKRVVIPCKEEDAFAYRDDWDTSFSMAQRQLKGAGVMLTVMEPTGFDATKLMGPEHPHFADGRGRLCGVYDCNTLRMPDSDYCAPCAMEF